MVGASSTRLEISQEKQSLTVAENGQGGCQRGEQELARVQIAGDTFLQAAEEKASVFTAHQCGLGRMQQGGELQDVYAWR